MPKGKGPAAPIKTVQICKKDGSQKMVVNEKDFTSMYEGKGYILQSAYNPEDALSDEPPKDTLPNGKDPIDPMKPPSDPNAGPLTGDPNS